MIKIKVSLSPEAVKDLKRVPDYIASKLYSWAEAVEKEGLENVRKVPGYHDEPLKGSRTGQRSIRLSLSYRAIYEAQIEGALRIIEVMEVNKHEY